MKKKISIYDIAKYCEVSPATVSYVINGKKKVLDETRKKVLAAIDELGYVMDHNARTLSTGKSNLIGLLLPLHDAASSFIINPFYAEFFSGIENVIADYDYDIVIGSIKNQENINVWAQSRRLDGIIILGDYSKNVYDELKELNIPIVLIDVYEDFSKEFNDIRIKDEEAVYNGTKYLIASGHTNIGFIGSKDKSLLDFKRYSGFKKAMEENNLDASIYFESSATFEDGYKCAKEMINDKKMTAAVCAADIIALGIMKYYGECGKTIPDDLSLIGFDDIADAKYVHPGLTTMHQDIKYKSKLAASILMENILNETVGNRLIEMDAPLIVRESVKNLK